MDIESRISAIEVRNKRVELDKEWEISSTRRVAILMMTYIILGIYMRLLNVEYWYLHALVPTFGYHFSTLALPVVRKFWEKSKKS